ncbi:hypothetical protein [Sutcliffiella horikoshii]|uniref:nSTAND3 domain-containing NTPase n=1 Tax=Sutcliffiella horikoshii TaxID=79883 RepID=UPI00384BD3ED
MSVERTGPEGYDYQYLVTAYLTLTNLDKENINLFVEKEGGEDAEITFPENGEEHKIEIQVKGTNSDIELRKLVKWLHHFPDRKHDENLLSRLINNKNSSVVFVTRGRCKDQVSDFIVKDSTYYHNNSPLNRDGITAYIDEIDNLFPEGTLQSTQLGKDRTTFCQNQRMQFNSSRQILKDVLKRVMIIEMLDEETLRTKVAHLLNKQFLIPQNQNEAVIRELMDVVRKARDLRTEISNDFKSVLESHSADKIFRYELDILRPEKNQLIEQLELNNMLLLTGISFCGKTHLARSIAWEFQRNGYRCIEETDVSEAIRFLSDESPEERLCILEDPFGHFNLSEYIVDTWSKLDDFSRKIKKHRKLIITSKKDLLTLYHKTDDLKNCSIYTYEWIDLTVTDKRLILEMWNMYAKQKQIVDNLITQVSQIVALENEEHLLQPGQIRNLALEIPIEKEKITKEEIIELAIIDSRKIGQYFSNQNLEFSKVIASLALGATTITTIEEKELAYLIDSHEEFPSINFTSEEEMYERDIDQSEDFPNYKKEYTLPDSITDIIDDLFTRGYISLQDGNIRFEHPTFLESAKYIQTHLTRRSEFKWYLELLKKAISCLDSKVAINATKQLKTIYNTYPQNKEIQRIVLTYSLKALHSIFPSVRDEALIFLISISEKLLKPEQDFLFKRLKVKPVSETNLRWHNGQPWLLNKLGFSLGEMAQFYLRNLAFKDEELIEIKNKFLSEDYLAQINLEEIWHLVNMFGRFDITREHSKELLYRMMLINQAFIRCEAACLLLQHFGDNKSYVNLVLNDPHPYVVYQGVRGIFLGWLNFNIETRRFLIEKLTEVFSKSSVAVVSHRFMLDFGDEHGNDNIRMYDMDTNDKLSVWELWAEIFPEFLSNLPTIRFKESDLDSTINQSLEKLPNNLILKVLESWINWINKNLSTRLLSDYALSVSSSLIKATQNNGSQREPFTWLLLNHEDTHFLTISLANYIDSWSILTTKEKEYIMELILDEREDSRWLRAVSLTRKKIPHEIQKLLLGDDNFLEKSVCEIVTLAPENLLHDSLSVFHGHPQPLWWIGLHHSGNLKWEQITHYLLNKYNHKSFSLVMRVWTDRLTDGSYTNNNKEIDLKLFRSICSTSDENVISVVFSLLLQWSATKVGVHAKELWSIFFYENNETRDKYENIIIEYIEPIESRSNYPDRVFGKEIFFNRLLPKIKPDFAIFKCFDYVSKLELNEKDRNNILCNTIKPLYEKQLPILNITNNLVDNICKGNESDASINLKELIKTAAMEIRKKEEEKEGKLDDHYILKGWKTITQ